MYACNHLPSNCASIWGRTSSAGILLLHIHCNATKKCKQGGSSENKTQTTVRLMRSFHPISPLHKMCFRSLPLWPRFALHYPTPMPLPITTLRDCDCPSPHSAQVSWKLLKNSFRTRYILFVVSDRPSLVMRRIHVSGS